MLKKIVHPHPALQFTHTLPYGAILHDGGVQFVVFSRSATAMRLLLYDEVDDREPAEIIDFDRDTDRWGDIWSIFVPGVSAGQLYHFQADGPYDPEHGQRFDGRARLIDPYAKALAGNFLPSHDGIIRPPKCVVVDDYFDWEGDRHLRRELRRDDHLRDARPRLHAATHRASVEHPGTYLGVIEKIPYLKSLGVTAVELMPVHEFPIERHLRPDAASGPTTGATTRWRSSRRTAATPSATSPAAQVNEFKQMVKALHQAGIEVILDVVFNHTCEGNELGPDAQLQGAGEPRLLHARQRRQLLHELLRLRQHGQRQPSRSSAR